MKSLSPTVGTRGVALVIIAAAVLLAPGAHAQESSYCRKVRARAAEDAAPISWPRLVGEVHRFPTDASMGPTIGETGTQLRLGASFSPTDLLRGSRLSAEAEAECDLHEVSQELLDAIAEAGNDALEPALAAQVAFLGSRRPEWTALLDAARERLKSGLITVIELQDLRHQIGQLERRLEFASGEEVRLRARAADGPRPGYQRASGSMARMAEVYSKRALEYEQAAAYARGPDAFRIDLTAGVIPSAGTSSADWYGAITVSWSVGALSRERAVRLGLSARRDEVARARQELPTRVAEVRRSMLAQAERARRELKVLAREIAAAEATRDAFQGREARGVEHARALLALELVSLEADRVHLTRLVDSIEALVE